MKKKLRLGFNGKFEDKDVEIAVNDPEPWDPSQKFSILGKRVTRLDGPATGRPGDVGLDPGVAEGLPARAETRHPLGVVPSEQLGDGHRIGLGVDRAAADPLVGEAGPLQIGPVLRQQNLLSDRVATRLRVSRVHD